MQLNSNRRDKEKCQQNLIYSIKVELVTDNNNV